MQPRIKGTTSFISDLNAWKTGGWRMTMRMSRREFDFKSLIADVMPSSMDLQALSKSIPAAPDEIQRENDQIPQNTLLTELR